LTCIPDASSCFDTAYDIPFSSSKRLIRIPGAIVVTIGLPISIAAANPEPSPSMTTIRGRLHLIAGHGRPPNL
jgi:hypothetical protein